MIFAVPLIKGYGFERDESDQLYESLQIQDDRDLVYFLLPRTFFRYGREDDGTSALMREAYRLERPVAIGYFPCEPQPQTIAEKVKFLPRGITPCKTMLFSPDSKSTDNMFMVVTPGPDPVQRKPLARPLKTSRKKAKDIVIAEPEIVEGLGFKSGSITPMSLVGINGRSPLSMKLIFDSSLLDKPPTQVDELYCRCLDLDPSHRDSLIDVLAGQHEYPLGPNRPSLIIHTSMIKQLLEERKYVVNEFNEAD